VTIHGRAFVANAGRAVPLPVDVKLVLADLVAAVVGVLVLYTTRGQRMNTLFATYDKAIRSRAKCKNSQRPTAIYACQPQMNSCSTWTIWTCCCRCHRCMSPNTSTLWRRHRSPRWLRLLPFGRTCFLVDALVSSHWYDSVVGGLVTPLRSTGDR
jgi:hypothetical protein